LSSPARTCATPGRSTPSPRRHAPRSSPPRTWRAASSSNGTSSVSSRSVRAPRSQRRRRSGGRPRDPSPGERRRAARRDRGSDVAHRARPQPWSGRHEAQLRLPGLRRVHRAPRRPSSELVHDTRDRGGRQAGGDDRGAGGRGEAPSAPRSVHRTVRFPVRLLHAGDDRLGESAPRRVSRAGCGDGAALDGRQHLPLHGLSDDRRGGARRGRADAGRPVKRAHRVVGTPARRAVVAAETRGGAAEAAELVNGSYEDLPAVIDADEALKPDAPVLHERRGERVGDEGMDEGEKGLVGNVCAIARVGWGNIDEALARAHLVVEGEYRYPMLYGYAMEPYNALAFFDQGDLVVFSTAQH